MTGICRAAALAERGAKPIRRLDVVARSHGRERVIELRGADQVARGALQFRRIASFVRPALINGAAGVVAFDGEQPFALLAFMVRDGRRSRSTSPAVAVMSRFSRKARRLSVVFGRFHREDAETFVTGVDMESMSA